MENRARRLLLGLQVVLAAALVTSVSLAAPVEPRTPDDLEELMTAIPETPGLEAELQRADKAFEARNWQTALDLYRRAAELTKNEVAYPLRRQCEALTELGRRDEAMRACKGMQNAKVSDAADLSAVVGALTLGQGSLSPSELEIAKLLVRRIENMEPDSVFARAAQCDVARRVGDTSALSACSRQLLQIAPEHRLTRRFQQVASEQGKGRMLQLFALALLAVAILATLAHRFLRGRRGTRAAAVAAAACLIAAPSIVHAQAVGIVEEPVDPNAPVYSGPPTKADLERDAELGAFKDEMKMLDELMGKINKAEEHITKNEWSKAVTLYNEVITTVPYFVKGWRRLCEGYVFLNMPEEGAHSCRQVLESKEATALDRAMLVHYLMSGPKRKDEASRQEAKRVAEEAVQLAPTERWGYDAKCEIAMVESDRTELANCSKKLQELAPDDRKTLAFNWTLAMMDKRFDDAQRLIEQAQQRGLDAVTAKRMQKELEAHLPLSARLKRNAPIGIAAGAGAALLILAIGRLVRRRRRAPETIEGSAPSVGA
ncbi:MAG: hypothetical protein ACOY0T_20760 [Myxococcota bacterium]